MTNYDTAIRPVYTGPSTMKRSEPSSPFEIHSIRSIMAQTERKTATPERNNFFTLIWITKGSGTQLIDVDKYEIKPGTIYCIAPGRVHFLGADANTDGYIISFKPEFMSLYENMPAASAGSGLFHSFLQHPVVDVFGQTETEMKEIAEKMGREFANFYLLRSEILRGLLKVFLIYLNRQRGETSRQAQHPRSRDIAGKFFMLLEKNYINRKMVADYASELSVTPNYLNEIIKKVSGFPASYHIQQRVILEAKRKAAYVNMSMKEIAYYLGFDDISHFSKFFKKASGTNFTDFKKQITRQFSFL